MIKTVIMQYNNPQTAAKDIQEMHNNPSIRVIDTQMSTTTNSAWVTYYQVLVIYEEVY